MDIKQYKNIIENGDKYVMTYLSTHDNKYLKQAIDIYESFLNQINLSDYLLIDSENKYVPKSVYIQCLYKLGTYYKTLVEREIEEYKNNNNNYILKDEHEEIFRKAINIFVDMIRVEFENELATTQLISIYTQLCFHSQHNLVKAIGYLLEGISHSPENTFLNYNLGFIYLKMNKLELSLSHYKLAIFTNQFNKDSKDKIINYINCYNGIAGIFRGVKQWPQCLYYLLKVNNIHPNEPTVCNQLGIAYTEMRRTDLAETFYLNGIKHIKESLVDKDHNRLLSEMYLNMGHMHGYNGNNNKSIDCYIKSLEINPKFILGFQNKIFNLCYLENEITDKFYISKEHKKINLLFKQVSNFNFEHLKNNTKLNIGIVSGDLVDHPVSYFINTLLTKYDVNKYNIYCYSECVIDIVSLNKNIIFKFIKHKNTQEVSNIIYNDKIHILFDLSGHTAHNRLDVFANKPAPIQISYIGYPYTTGLKNMDYRITDYICDNKEISQKFYTEKLLFMPNCFLCYDIKDKLQQLTTNQPFIKNKYLTLSCFNRLNKINTSVIKLFNNILSKVKNVRLRLKTKAFNNNDIKKEFLSKFDLENKERIDITNCTILHEQHLLEYNNVDIAIDTFPYSGTTTSCEALMMGVPVLTMYDNVNYYHPQNVTASILKNSNMDEYVFTDENQLINKIQELLLKDDIFWKNLKSNTRNTFLNGIVCNQELYMKHMDEILYNVYSKFNDN